MYEYRGSRSVRFSRYRDHALAAMGTVMDSGTFPLRVIDLGGTFDSKGGIIFSTPKEWNFHMISHTWSQDIRELSKEVGGAVKELGIDSSGLRYEDVFKQANLADRPGYAHLVEFLKIIQTDGVERAWVDAVCINQIDQTEKSQEITHMGAYYYHSLGCYVVIHGFGLGYQLKVNGDNWKEMPRWFSRVWTLQELLLPRSLTFVVELAREDAQAALHKAEELHEMGICSCDPRKTRMARFQKLLQVQTGRSSSNKLSCWQRLEILGNGCCMGGRFQRVPYVDQPQLIAGGGVQEQKVLCFVDRDAFAYLCCLLNPTGLLKRDSKYIAMACPQFIGPELWTSRFKALEEAKGTGHAAVLAEVAGRECCEEEDRVLAVLALLGLDGKKMPQLRVGQTFAEQMMQMCSVMAQCNPGSLIALCATFMRPSLYSKNLSWAPHFHVDERAERWPHYGEDFWEVDSPIDPSCVSKVSVGPRGLSLCCHVLKGRLLRSLQLCCYAERAFVLEIAKGHSLGFINCRGLVHGTNSDANADQVELSPDQINNGREYFQGGMVIPISNSNIDFPVWLLLLGTSEPRRAFFDCGTSRPTPTPQSTSQPGAPFDPKVHPKPALVFMVCVGETQENLHKIGMVRILRTYTTPNGNRSTIQLASFRSMECTVGGFEKREYDTWILKQRDASHVHE